MVKLAHGHAKVIHVATVNGGFNIGPTKVEVQTTNAFDCWEYCGVNKNEVDPLRAPPICCVGYSRGFEFFTVLIDQVYIFDKCLE